jgi:hypothetical protein
MKTLSIALFKISKLAVVMEEVTCLLLVDHQALQEQLATQLELLLLVKPLYQLFK